MVSRHPNRRDETLLVATSREHTGGSKTTNADFTVHLNNNSKTNGITAAHLNHVTVPNMFDNVREGLNTITVTLKGGTSDITHNLTIPARHYATLDDILTEVNTAATNAGIPLTMTSNNSDHTFWSWGGQEVPPPPVPDPTGPMTLIDMSNLDSIGAFVEENDPLIIAGNGMNDHQGEMINNTWTRLFFTVHKTVQISGFKLFGWGDDNPALTNPRKHEVTIWKFTQNPDAGYTDETLWPNATDLYAQYASGYSGSLTQFSYHTVIEESRSGNVITCSIEKVNPGGGPSMVNGRIELPPGNYLVSDNIGSSKGTEIEALDLWKDHSLWGGAYFGTGIRNTAITSGFHLDGGQLGQLTTPGFRVWDERITNDPLFYRYWCYGSPIFHDPSITTKRTMAPRSQQWYDVHLSSPTAGQEGDLLTHVLGIDNGVGPGLSDPNTGVAAGISSAPVNTNGPQTVFLCSTMLAEGNAIGVGDGTGTKLEQPVIDMIPMNVPRGSFAWYQPNEVVANLLRYKHRKQLSRIDFRLTDTMGRTLALPHNYHVTVVLRLIHESLDGV